MFRYLSVIVLVFTFVTLKANAIFYPTKTQPKALVVLVPGTLNSVLPGSLIGDPKNGFEYNPYFSETIVKVFLEQNFSVLVINRLDPLGDFQKNGEITFSQTYKIYNEHYGRLNIPIYMIAHSAGGFYSFYASDINKNLPIKKIVLVSCPMGGSELAEVVFEKGKLGEWFRRSLETISNPFIDLRGITRIGPKHVSQFLSEVNIESNVQVYSTTSSQSRPSVLKTYDSKFLSPILQLTSRFLPGKSDGIVSVESTLKYSEPLLNRDGQVVKITQLTTTANLDHAEEVLDHRLFKVFGFYNTDYIRDSQKEWYTNILAEILTK